MIRHFPNDGVFTPQAMIELGLIHVSDNRLPEAQQSFDRLVAYGDTNPKWQAAGWLGQAILLNKQQRYADSQLLLAEKRESLQKYLPERMREYGLLTLQSNEAALNKGRDDKLRKAFEIP